MSALSRRKNTCVTIAEPSGTTEYGDACFGEQVEVEAWHERKLRTFRDPSGDERTVTDRLVTDCEIPYGSSVWLSGEDVKQAAPHRAVVVMGGDSFRGKRVHETWLAPSA